MKSVSRKRLGKILEQRGWTVLTVQGSPHIYGKAGSDARLSVPIQGNQTLKIGLLRHLIKIAGISERDF